MGVSFSGRQLNVNASLHPGLPAETVERLASGLATTATWDVHLLIDRGIWPDGVKDDRRYQVTATYRPVTSDWTVERRLDGKLLEARTVPSRAEALEALERLHGLPSFVMGPHLVGKVLFVRVRCTYGTGVSFGVVPTSTATAWESSERFTWKGERY